MDVKELFALMHVLIGAMGARKRGVAQAALRDMERKFDSEQAHASAMAEEMGRDDQEISRLEGEKAEQSRSIDSLRSSIRTLQDHAADLDAEIRRLRSGEEFQAVAVLQKEVARLRDEVARQLPGMLAASVAHKSLYVRTGWMCANKIEAIKLLRYATWLGLKEAKEEVERLMGLVDRTWGWTLLIAEVNPVHKVEESEPYRKALADSAVQYV